MRDTANPVVQSKIQGSETAPRRPVVPPEGHKVRVRAVSRVDEERLRRMFSRLSQRSIYHRFHMPYPRVPEWAVALFANVDDYLGESIVAVAGDEIVGHAVYVRSDHGHDAEMAILVEDAWQSRGVGRMLVSELGRSAAGRGFVSLMGEVLGENHHALGLLTSVFAGTEYTMRGGVYHTRMPLRAFPPVANLAETSQSAA